MVQKMMACVDWNKIYIIDILWLCFSFECGTREYRRKLSLLLGLVLGDDMPYGKAKEVLVNDTSISRVKLLTLFVFFFGFAQSDIVKDNNHKDD